MGNLNQDTVNMTDTESDTEDLLALQNGSNRESSSDIERLDTDNLSDIIVSGAYRSIVCVDLLLINLWLSTSWQIDNLMVSEPTSAILNFCQRKVSKPSPL